PQSVRTRTCPAGAGETEKGHSRGGARPLSPVAPVPGAIAKASRGGREVAREALPGASARGRRGSRGSGGGAGTGPGSLAESAPATAPDTRCAGRGSAVTRAGLGGGRQSASTSQCSASICRSPRLFFVFSSLLLFFFFDSRKVAI
ncbi:unnamed protein product, partial [Rangifer tarandus platyrhynchus]